MRLIKSMCLTASVRLIERVWELKMGPSTMCVVPLLEASAKITKITMEEYTIESIIRGHHVYIKSIWHPILGARAAHS